MDQENKFLKAWLRNNILAYALGLGLLHPIIAHGFTGDHDVELTMAQFIMHTLSLFVFAIILVIMRNRAFRYVANIKLYTGLISAVIFIPSFFWLGYYTLYIPFDILFSFLCIGFLNGWHLKPFMKNKSKWVWQSLLASFCGALAGISIGIGSYFLFIKNMKGLSADFTIWILISVPASIVSSLMSRNFLRKNSSGEENRAAP